MNSLSRCSTRLGRTRLLKLRLQALNQRYIPNFVPPKESNYIRLTTHNAPAQYINEQQLAALPSQAFSFTAEIEGDFPESSYPADFKLTLKPGAQVMFIKNDPQHRFYNGMIGEVIGVRTDEDGSKITVRSKDSGEEFDLEKMEWTQCEIYAERENQGDRGDGGGKIHAVSSASGVGDNYPQESGTYFRTCHHRCFSFFYPWSDLCGAEPLQDFGGNGAQSTAFSRSHYQQPDGGCIHQSACCAYSGANQLVWSSNTSFIASANSSISIPSEPAMSI